MEEVKLECSVCGERYARGEHCPRSLLCGHVFCTTCLDRVISAGSPKCPTCSRPFISFSATQLPTNFTVLKRATTTNTTTHKGAGILTSSRGSTLDVPGYQSLSSSTYRSKSLDAITSSSYLSKPLSSSLSSSYQPLDLSSSYLPKTLTSTSSSSNFSKLPDSTSSSSDLSKPLVSTSSSSDLSKPLNYASSSNLQVSTTRSTLPATHEIKSPGSKGLQLPLIGSPSPTYTKLEPKLFPASILSSQLNVKSLPPSSQSSHASSIPNYKTTDVVD